MKVPVTESITAEHMEEAKERLILARETHLDSLVDRLREDRVRAIIEPLMAGTHTDSEDIYSDNFVYVRDLGLIARNPPLRPANPVYREVMARVLALGIERQIVHDSKPFVQPDGRLDMDKLLHAFAEFWREHGDVLTGSMIYHEVAPQLVLMAFLQRIVNARTLRKEGERSELPERPYRTGFIDREYGIGRGRIDLLIRWPYTDESGERQWQREALELKVWRDKKRDPLDQGLTQLGEYLTRLGLDRGVLVLFDRRSDAVPLKDRIAFGEARSPDGHAITVLRA